MGFSTLIHLSSDIISLVEMTYTHYQSFFLSIGELALVLSLSYSMFKSLNYVIKLQLNYVIKLQNVSILAVFI